jgi:hypothetical protein
MQGNRGKTTMLQVQMLPTCKADPGKTTMLQVQMLPTCKADPWKNNQAAGTNASNMQGRPLEKQPCCRYKCFQHAGQPWKNTKLQVQMLPTCRADPGKTTMMLEQILPLFTPAPSKTIMVGALIAIVFAVARCFLIGSRPATSLEKQPFYPYLYPSKSFSNSL